MFIIAEVGSNWATREDCLNSISLAAKCGANAVKFQMFTSEELYGFNGRDLSACSLPREWIAGLAEKANACGIEFMCTAFSAEGLKFINPYVKRHKIASSDLCYLELLAAAKETGKPLIVSTGGHTVNDVSLAKDFLNGCDVTWLYCESSYPSNYIDMRKVSMLAPFGKYGLSDHSREIYSVPQWADDVGCLVLEKHVQFVDGVFPDSPHSLNCAEFKEMINAFSGRDSGSLLSGPEKDMVLEHNRRLIATVDISKGEALQFGVNFGSFRSLKPTWEGFHPFSSSKVNGKILITDLKQGDAIDFKHLELTK